jgi:hypothetical protein
MVVGPGFKAMAVSHMVVFCTGFAAKIGNIQISAWSMIPLKPFQRGSLTTLKSFQRGH